MFNVQTYLDNQDQPDLNTKLQFWWVNQGDSYEKQSKGGYLWAPKEAKDARKVEHWLNMTRLKSGNFIFNYAKGALRAVSQVLETAVDFERPTEIPQSLGWNSMGYLVRVKYYELSEPIILEEIPLEWRIEEGEPFTKKGFVRQGYLYPLSREFVTKLIQYFVKELSDFLPSDEPQILLTPPIVDSRTKKVKINDEYTVTIFTEETGVNEVEINRWIRVIGRKKQVVFYGAPGTGKTFVAGKLAQYLISGYDGFSNLVQFHPAYSYEDFIQGIRPQSQDGQLEYSMVQGRFIEFCKKAEDCEGLCVLIIDEMNRANLANVFGELMYLLEYRNKKICLAGSSEPFGIPDNVRIIGTMNTADRSIALVDHALRRRFAFIELRPNYEVLRRYHQKKKTNFQVDGLIETLERLNKAIADKHYEVGISYFLTENLAEEIEDIWQMEIEPYLEEYFYDQLDKADEFRWDNIKQQVCP